MTASDIDRSVSRDSTPLLGDASAPTAKSGRLLGSSRVGDGLLQLAAIVLVLGLWELVTRAGLVSATAVCPPDEAVKKLVAELGTHSFWSATGVTMRNWTLGLAISIGLGGAAGMLLGVSRLAFLSSRFVVDFCRTIPPLALLPVITLLYGTGTRSEVILVVVATVWPVLLQTQYGVRDVDTVTLETATSYRLSRPSRIIDVVLPSAAPFIATGIRISSAMALLVCISTELLTGNGGLGALIAVAQQNGDIAKMYAYLLFTGFLGILVNTLIAQLERHTLRWRPAQGDRS